MIFHRDDYQTATALLSRGGDCRQWHHGVTYYAPETGRYYAVDHNDVIDLGEAVLSGREDAYSHWCSEVDAEGYATEEHARVAAGWGA
jgi:hypothetical protein